MTRKFRHQRCSKSRQVEPQKPATSIQQPPANCLEQRENENFRAKKIEELIAPIFNFPFAGEYNTELELDIPKQSKTTLLLVGNLKTQNRPNKLQVPIARPWEQQLVSQPHQQDACSDLEQAPLVVWENQGPIEEPFNCIGEVILMPECHVTDKIHSVRCLTEPRKEGSTARIK